MVFVFKCECGAMFVLGDKHISQRWLTCPGCGKRKYISDDVSEFFTNPEPFTIHSVPDDTKITFSFNE